MKKDRLKKYFADYKTHHQSQKNILTHYFGVPMIVVAVFGMTSNLFFFGASVSQWIWCLANLFYLSLNIRLGLMMTFLTALCLFMGMKLSFWANLFLFITGWYLQFLGHIKYEKKSPSFYKNLLHLLIGPAFIGKLLFQNCLQKFRWK